MARAIAAKVVQALGAEPNVPSEPLELGETSLLYMELRTAAEYFGVAKPSSKRDRKSGAKKRRQTDIEAAQVLARAVNG
jgi:DNA (cytosine-5)-methyltransferase 1